MSRLVLDMDMRNFLKEHKLTLVESFSVLYSGWEMDGTWYLCQRENGEKVVVATSHGDPYITGRETLEQRCEEYRKVLQKTESILAQI